MGLRTPGLTVEIAVSTMDLYPYDLPGRPSWASGLESLVPYLEETGACNFEVHPTEAIVREVAAHKTRGDTDLVRDTVGSLHQTFNQGGTVCSKVADRCGVQRALRSVGGMTTIQEALGRPVPSIHYPSWPMIRLPWHTVRILPEYPGSFPIIQPSAEVYRDYRVSTTNDLLDRMSVDDIIGLCPDTVWARAKAQDGTPPPPVAEAWESQFSSGRAFQMHVSMGRYDLAAHGDKKLASRSGEELRAFRSRNWRTARDTELGEMIVAAVEAWHPPEELVATVGKPLVRQVLEIPPSPNPLDFIRRASQHARVVENLAEIIRETGAIPKLRGDAID